MPQRPLECDGIRVVSVKTGIAPVLQVYRAQMMRWRARRVGKEFLDPSALIHLAPRAVAAMRLRQCGWAMAANATDNVPSVELHALAFFNRARSNPQLIGRLGGTMYQPGQPKQ